MGLEIKLLPLMLSMSAFVAAVVWRPLSVIGLLNGLPLVKIAAEAEVKPSSPVSVVPPITFTVSPEGMALALCGSSTPLVTVTAPVKLLSTDSTVVPAPFMLMLPEPAVRSTIVEDMVIVVEAAGTKPMTVPA